MPCLDNPGLYVGEYSDRLKTVGDVFTDEYYGISIAKRNADLVDKINAAIAELEAEGKFEELSQKWLQ